jgi:hypothetical protein
LFEDAESGRTLFIDPATARSGYLKKLETHTGALQLICRRHGVGWQRISTADPLDSALFEFLQARLQRGRVSRTAAGNSGRSKR